MPEFAQNHRQNAPSSFLLQLGESCERRWRHGGRGEFVLGDGRSRCRAPWLPGFLNTPQAFIILISGHVQQANIQKALFVYREMADRGLTTARDAQPEWVIRIPQAGIARLPGVEAKRLEHVLNAIAAVALPGDTAKSGSGTESGARHSPRGPRSKTAPSLSPRPRKAT